MFKNVGLPASQPSRQPTAPPPPFGKKKPGLDVAIDIGKDKAPADPMGEAGESAADEGAEEYGDKLIGDMTKPLLDAGMDPDTAKHTLAGIFEAMGKCLRGDSGGPPDMGGSPDGGMGSA